MAVYLTTRLGLLYSTNKQKKVRKKGIKNNFRLKGYFFTERAELVK